jgi:hypothetical protein
VRVQRTDPITQCIVGLGGSVLTGPPCVKGHLALPHV